MLFNAKDLLINQQKIADPFNESITLYALDCIRESDQFLRNSIQGILGEAVMSEFSIRSFNGNFDFISIIKGIIDWFLSTLDKIFRQFMVGLNQFIGSSSPIKKYKDDLLNYTHTVKVYFDHYRYSNLDADIPPSTLDMYFKEEYDVLYEDLQRIGSMSNQKEIIICELNKLKEKLKSEDKNYYNLLRRKVLGSAYQGTGDIIIEKNYIEELKLAFRSNMSSPTEEDIPSYEVKDAAKRFFNNKELTNNLKSHKKSIEKIAGKIKRDIDKIAPENFMKEYQPIDYEIEFVLKEICQLQTERLSKACNIITLAYSTKLDILKESLIQDKKVLFAAIHTMIKEG